MKIEISKEQLKEMILAAMFYDWILGGLADSKGEDFEKYGKLESFLLKVAKENNFNDLTEEFHNTLVPTDELSEFQEEIIEEYDSDVFWHELEVAFGKRDFWRTVTPEEKEEMKKNDWLPERIHEIYEKYAKEFEKHGIDRLEIKTELPKIQGNTKQEPKIGF